MENLFSCVLLFFISPVVTIAANFLRGNDCIYSLIRLISFNNQTTTLKKVELLPPKNLEMSIPKLRPVVLSGPSGAGKSTILKMLFAEYPGLFGFSVSHTTRKPRAGETDGVEYNFSDREICILDVEKKGCESLRATDLNARFLQLRPPSLEILEQRLRARNTETEDSLRKRLDEAVQSMAYGLEPGKFEKLIINDSVETSYSELKAALVEDIAAAQALRGKA